MKDLQREILSLVANGSITAEEGAARLQALEAPEPARTATTSAPAQPQPAAATGATRVRVASRFGNAEIVGDPAVDVAVAEGPHRVRVEGDTMVIEQSPIHEDTTFEFSKPEGRLVINNFDFGRKLLVRMNPSLPLSASVQAGNARVTGVTGPISGEVQAGNWQIEGCRGPLDVSVAAGNFTASGRLEGGESHVRCDMGSVRVNLERGSSVRITANATLGKVAIEGEQASRAGGGKREVTIGGGAGTLDIVCSMGNVRVQAE